MSTPRNIPRRVKRWPYLSLALAAAILSVVLWRLTPDPSDRGEAQAAAVAAADEECIGVTRQALVQGMIQDISNTPHPSILHGVVHSGDTASGLFDQWLSPVELVRMAEACKEVHSLRRLRPGRPYAVGVLEDRLVGFEYEADADRRLVAERDGDGFTARMEPIAYDVETVRVRGAIESSLIEAMLAAGEETALALELADIFAWDVDFCRDLRPGDEFVCLVQKRYRNGVLAGYGPILAARFVNQGDVYQGFRYPDEKGNPSYFDESGKSLRKVFLKAPLSFRRISSGFSYRRFHPILKYYRPHTGVDYAAPTGTPVWTVGDGEVVKRGRSKSAGNYIRIRHNGAYTTQYCHLSRFARNMRRGAKVRQGQVIGYVGSTGYATGPHLDFRMYYRGKPINPRTVKAASCKPVPGERMDEFSSLAADLHTALDGKTAGGQLALKTEDR